MSIEKNRVMKKYYFTLYVDSEDKNSVMVIDRLEGLCSKFLIDPYLLDVVDVQKEISRSITNNVLAVPTLDVITPGDQKHRFIGDLSNIEVFISAIGMGQTAIRMKSESAIMKDKVIQMHVDLKKT